MSKLKSCQSLNKAAERGDLEKVKMLLKNGADINGNSDLTPLQGALAFDHWEVAKFLVEQGADPDIKIDANGCLVLNKHWRNLSTVQFFIEQGGDINAKDRDKKTLLHHAVTKKNFEMVKFLVDKGADINASYCKKTPLHYAAIFNRLDITKFLVENGADINLKDIDGKTPFDSIYFTNHSEVLLFLKQAHCAASTAEHQNEKGCALSGETTTIESID